MKSLLLSPSTTLKGDIETVSVHPSVRKESPLTATIFHRSLPNFYSIFISLKNFIICSFIKKWQKLLPWQQFFFWPLMHICLYLFLTWRHECTFLSNFYNIFIKVQHNFSAIFCKLWPKNCCHGNTFTLHFSLFPLFKNDSISCNCKTFYIILSKLVCMLGFIQRIFIFKVTLSSLFSKTNSVLTSKIASFQL